MTDAARSDYSWSLPNRRFIDSGLYLPSIRSEGIDTVAVIIDTSASLPAQTLAEFWTEVREFVSELQPETVIVLQVDAALRDAAQYSPSGLSEKIALNRVVSAARVDVHDTAVAVDNFRPFVAVLPFGKYEIPGVEVVDGKPLQEYRAAAVSREVDRHALSVGSDGQVAEVSNFRKGAEVDTVRTIGEVGDGVGAVVGREHEYVVAARRGVRAVACGIDNPVSSVIATIP